MLALAPTNRLTHCPGLLVLLAVCGCGRLQGCGGSRSAPAAPAQTTSSAAQLPRVQATGTPSAEPDSPEARLAGRFLVIAHSSLNAAEGEPILEALQAKAPELEARQLISTPFTQLRPCLAVVVAGAFATKEEAVALTQRLKKAGGGGLREGRGTARAGPRGSGGRLRGRGQV